ncbi:dUTP diphosphatase [Fictibacillus sp. 5RED26]|jgi:dimeric dUTPase (all-alpha-NTP-PPase superfamily)|uniref:dUTP diphosphatase n=1 Tax=Fictibacillus sp. 5RED26 TaxID=2745876 RepID=UPI0018CE4428|nr:dUTP diphosphatase [Fictibacillus sp. 5RED26]MBH0159084.1 dUTP diphosphatase [Fictibacillus sp. 5RED26]
MNIPLMFETQESLRSRIIQEHNLDPNSKEFSDNLTLAFYVEVGECANEWRGFKQWSKKRTPVTKKVEFAFGNPGGAFEIVTNPLLEEYVDGFHFLLEKGLEIGLSTFEPTIVKVNNPGTMFRETYTLIAQLEKAKNYHIKSFYYGVLFNHYLALGKSLGFTTKEIESAYFEKNKVNFQRQEDGY